MVILSTYSRLLVGLVFRQFKASYLTGIVLQTSKVGKRPPGFPSFVCTYVRLHPEKNR